MGDNIDEGFFEGETAVQDIRTGGAYDSGGESEQEEAVAEEEVAMSAEKSSKRKKKFAELKKVIADKRQKTNEDSGGAKEEKSGTSSEEQWTSFLASQPVNKHTGKLNCMLSQEHFLDNAPIHGEDASVPCAFTLAVDAANLRKRLKEGSAAKAGEMGCPTVLVLCASSLRASQVFNRMKGLLRCPHIKLFAKHLKIQDQVEQLGKEHFPVAVGTPNRVLKLFELGALSGDALQLVLVDNALDAKQFTVMTLNDVREDFFSVMGRMVQNRCEAGSCRVALVGSGASAVVVGPGERKANPKGMGSGRRKGF